MSPQVHPIYKIILPVFIVISVVSCGGGGGNTPPPPAGGAWTLSKELVTNSNSPADSYFGYGSPGIVFSPDSQTLAISESNGKSDPTNRYGNVQLFINLAGTVLVFEKTQTGWKPTGEPPVLSTPMVSSAVQNVVAVRGVNKQNSTSVIRIFDLAQ